MLGPALPAAHYLPTTCPASDTSYTIVEPLVEPGHIFDFLIFSLQMTREPEVNYMGSRVGWLTVLEPELLLLTISSPFCITSYYDPVLCGIFRTNLALCYRRQMVYEA